MIREITAKQRKKIDDIMSKMTEEEKIGQVQCLNASKLPEEQLRYFIDNFHIGSVFVGNVDKPRLAEVVRIIKDSKIPIILNGDFVNGVGSRIEGFTEFPQQMACAAANDKDLMVKMGEVTSSEGRAHGIEWTFGPVIDLCLNQQNPMMHIRTAGDIKERVLMVGKSFIEGVQSKGLMSATAKHFPGDGIDARDTHITTLINRLSREDWMNSYGYIWKGVIEAGVMSIMSGHIALPFVDPQYEDVNQRYKGPRPATLSKKILIDFLRGELGFQGTIVTDAVNMIGLGAHLQRKDYGVRLLDAGNDMLLWTKPEIDSVQIAKGLKDGSLSYQRLDDAVRHVLELKARVGMLDEEEPKVELSPNYLQENEVYAQQVADKAIVVYRDVFNQLPIVGLKKGSKVLTVTLTFEEGIRNGRDSKDLETIDEELRARGFVVDHLVNPDEESNFKSVVKNYDMVFINFKYPAKYGTIRLMGKAIPPMKGSWWVENKKVIFTAFGDPFKIYDLPGLHNYVCGFSVRDTIQRAVVKTWFGENKYKGSSPVNMDRFLEYQWDKMW